MQSLLLRKLSSLLSRHECASRVHNDWSLPRMTCIPFKHQQSSPFHLSSSYTCSSIHSFTMLINPSGVASLLALCSFSSAASLPHRRSTESDVSLFVYGTDTDGNGPNGGPIFYVDGKNLSLCLHPVSYARDRPRICRYCSCTVMGYSGYKHYLHSRP